MGTLASEFKSDLLQVAVSRSSHNLSSGEGGAGESHLKQQMRDEHRTQLLLPMEVTNLVDIQVRRKSCATNGAF